MKFNKLFLVIGIFFMKPLMSLADDGASAIAAGGVVVFKKLPEVSMEDEVLLISPEKVEVSFVFKNNSDHSITSEVAFPIPAYGYSSYQEEKPQFVDFTVVVNGKKVEFRESPKAMLGEKDVTSLLKEMAIPIVDIYVAAEKIVPNLKTSDRKRLSSLGLLGKKENGDDAPLWKIATNYHWTQIFLAHSEVKIRHTYTPHIGYSQYSLSEVGDLNKDVCVDTQTKKGILKILSTKNENRGTFSWVKYILLSANTWGGPIRHFHLILDKLSPDKVLSTCFRGLKKTSPTRFEAELKDFTPTSDLSVFYF